MAIFFSSSPFAAFGNPFGVGNFNPMESNVAGVSGLRVFNPSVGSNPFGSNLGPAFAPTLSGQSVFSSGLFGGLFAPQTNMLQSVLLLSLLNGGLQGGGAQNTQRPAANNRSMADVDRFFANARNARNGNQQAVAQKQVVATNDHGGGGEAGAQPSFVDSGGGP